jgi:hypothetical protein
MTIGLVLLAAGIVAAAPHAENPVYHEVTRVGVSLGGKEPFRLPQPTMADGLDAKTQEKLLSEIAGRAYPLPRFLKNSAVSPHVLKQSELSGDATGRGREISVWFVAYGDLDQFFDKRFRDQMLSSDDDPDLSSQGGSLDAAQLKARDIPWKEADREVESYSHGAMSLWKRVKVAATVRTFSSRTDDSVIFAAMIDPRFADDREFPNRWWSLTKSATGVLETGKPNPYGGMGTYLKATRLASPAGALLVEWRIVFSEPEGWFGGANQLGAKVPAIVQSRVRSMRRELVVDGKAKP